MNSTLIWNHVNNCLFLTSTIANCSIYYLQNTLTHWGQMTHICVCKTTIIGSENGLLPGRRQAIIWINAGKLFIGNLGTNFSEIFIECHSFSFKKMHMKMAAILSRPQCLNGQVSPHLEHQSRYVSKLTKYNKILKFGLDFYKLWSKRLHGVWLLISNVSRVWDTYCCYHGIYGMK